MQALIIIDIQNDYFPGGKMELCGSEAAANNAALLLKAFRKAGKPVFHVQHISLAPTATFFLPGTTGALIHGSVAPLSGEAVVEKHFPNSFRDTTLLGLLQAQNITDIAIAGMMTHMCVDTTTRAAFDLGFTCHLAHDACATRDLAHDGKTVCAADVQTAYMAALGQVFAQVRSTQELCAAVSQSR